MGYHQVLPERVKDSQEVLAKAPKGFNRELLLHWYCLGLLLHILLHRRYPRDPRHQPLLALHTLRRHLVGALAALAYPADHCQINIYQFKFYFISCKFFNNNFRNHVVFLHFSKLLRIISKFFLIVLIWKRHASKMLVNIHFIFNYIYNSNLYF